MRHRRRRGHRDRRRRGPHARSRDPRRRSRLPPAPGPGGGGGRVGARAGVGSARPHCGADEPVVVSAHEGGLMRCSLVIAVTLLVTAMALPVAAQPYPTRPIQFVIPFATGGPTDTAIRVIQPQLAAGLGVPVVLVNKPGGGGAVGMDGVAKARPDGYTLAATVRSTLTILPATQPDVTYKISDFAVIGSYAIDSGVILIKAGAPWKTLEEFVDHAKKNPGTVTYGSAGPGTQNYFHKETAQQSYC